MANTETVKGRWNYIFGAILMNIGIISVRAVNFLSLYYISYYSKLSNPPSIKAGVSFFMGPIYSLVSLLFVPLSGLFEKKIGLRGTYLISFTLIYFVSTLFYCTDTFWLFIVGIAILGASVGISSINIKIGCYFFPGKEGLLSGVEKAYTMSFIYLWFYIGEKIINPDKVETSKIDDLYDSPIAKRIKNFTLVFGCATFLGMIIFYSLTLPINFGTVEERYKLIKAKMIQEMQKGKEEALTGIVKDEPLELSVKEKTKKYKRELKEIFTSWSFWKLFILVIFIGFTPSLITCTFRIFSSKNDIPLNIVTLDWTISGVIGSLILYMVIYVIKLDFDLYL